MSLKFENVSFSYVKERKVLENIDYEIKNNESIGIIGANGAGKSTMLKLIVGLMDNYEGKILVNDELVCHKNIRNIRKKVGFVFQDSDSQLFLSTVYEDVAFGPRNYGFSEEEVNKRATLALKKVNIEDLKDRQIYRMSGGQKKLASIATILSMEPEIILFDEPSIALDPKNRRNLINVLNELSCTKIIASHDLDFIMDTCERTILIQKGRIIFDGKTQEIMKNKNLLEENGLELPLSYQRTVL